MLHISVGGQVGGERTQGLSVDITFKMLNGVGCFCRYHFCEKCFNEIQGESVTLGDDPAQPQT